MKLNFILNKFKNGLLSILPMQFVNTRNLFTMTSTTSKLSELRKLMNDRDLVAYYVPSEDAHQVTKKS